MLQDGVRCSPPFVAQRHLAIYLRRRVCARHMAAAYNAGSWADRLRHCPPVGLLILLRIRPGISGGIVISA